MKGWKNIFHADGNEKKGSVPILILDNISFRTKNDKRQRRALHDDKGVSLIRG